MNLFQIRAFVPGKGEINLIASPSLEEAAKLLAGGSSDPYGNESFKPWRRHPGTVRESHSRQALGRR